MQNAHGLSDKQQRFVDEYLIDFNATAAAKRAGYSPKSAKQVGARNMTKAAIRELIDAAKAKLTAGSQLTAKRVLEQIAKIAFVELGGYVDDKGQLDLVRFARENPAALEQWETEQTTSGTGKRSSTTTRNKARVHDSLEALRDLGRYFKLFQTDVKPGDVPKGATPAAPKAIHEYSDEDLLKMIADGQRRKR